MGTTTLTCRRTQLEVLAEACRRSRPVRLTLRRTRDAAPSTDAHLVALRRDGVIVRVPGGSDPGALSPGSAVEADFELDGVHYSFRTHGCGSVVPPGACDRSSACARLRVPLCIEHKHRSPRPRSATRAGEALQASLRGVLRPQALMQMRVTEVSPAGFETRLPRERAAKLQPGELFWADFDLPGTSSRGAAVVRAGRPQEVPGGGPDVAVPWEVCAGDSPALYRRSLAGLKRALAERRRASRAHAHGGDGR